MYSIHFRSECADHFNTQTSVKEDMKYSLNFFNMNLKKHSETINQNIDTSVILITNLLHPIFINLYSEKVFITRFKNWDGF